MSFCVSCNFKAHPVGTQWAQAEGSPRFSYVWCRSTSYLRHGWQNKFSFQVSLCMQACLHYVTSHQRFFCLCSIPDMAGNLYSDHLDMWLMNWSSVILGLLQRAGLHCEWSESTSSVWVALAATPIPWLVLLDVEQTAECAGPVQPCRFSQQLLPNLLTSVRISSSLYLGNVPCQTTCNISSIQQCL